MSQRQDLRDRTQPRRWVPACCALLLLAAGCEGQLGGSDATRPDAARSLDAAYEDVADADHEITSFTLRAADNAELSADVVGELAGLEITLSVPGGIALTSLTPSVTYLGETLTPASGTAQDFSRPVSYTVTAGDGSSSVYRVSVTTVCAAGLTLCGADCVDTASTDAQCGACGHACLTGERCNAGTCVDANGCEPLSFPSVRIRTVPGPASLLSEYASISDSSCFPMPRCFIDTNNLIDADTGARLDTNVHLSANFVLSEFVGGELTYGPYVLISPSLVSKLQRVRELSGGSLRIASAFRSPAHQRATCRSICGADSCTGSHPCARRSRHSWGDAADLGIAASRYEEYARYSMSAAFPDCLLEAGSFHVDTSACPVGCPYRF